MYTKHQCSNYTCSLPVDDECDQLNIYFATDTAGLTQFQDVLYIVHDHTCQHNSALVIIQISFAEYIPIPINAML